VVKHIRTDELHQVGWLGPPKDRDPEYIRDREFDHLVHLGGAGNAGAGRRGRRHQRRELSEAR
jgi:hypothetical protein